MRIHGVKREEKRFKNQYKMRVHGILGLSRGERNAIKKRKEKTKQQKEKSINNFFILKK